MDFSFHIKLIIILISTFVLALVANRVLKKLAAKPGFRDGLSTFFQSFISICTLLILGLGLLFSLDLTAHYYELSFSRDLISQVRNLLVVVLLTWLLLSWKNRYETLLTEKISEGKKGVRDLSLITGVSKFLTLFLIIASSLLILGIFKINYNALLAFGGLGGLAVSWAAKDVIANFFGGLMIHINRPFSIGDWIKSTNKNFEGVVEQIGWYMTRIRSLERRPTYIPNALITDAIIENPGRMYNRRIQTAFGLCYEDYPLVPTIISEIEEMLQNHDEIAKNQLLMVHLTEFNKSTIDIEVYCFTKKTNLNEFRDIQQDILFKVGNIITGLGAKFPYPTQTIHLAKNNP